MTTLFADIEQPLTGRNLIKPADLFPKQAKDFHLYLVEPFNQVMDRALDGHADPMNPFEELEDPTQGWPLSRLVDLMWYRFIAIGSLLTQSALRQRIYQQSQGHHHQ